MIGYIHVFMITAKCTQVDPLCDPWVTRGHWFSCLKGHWKEQSFQVSGGRKVWQALHQAASSWLDNPRRFFCPKKITKSSGICWSVDTEYRTKAQKWKYGGGSMDFYPPVKYGLCLTNTAHGTVITVLVMWQLCLKSLGVEELQTPEKLCVVTC